MADRRNAIVTDDIRELLSDRPQPKPVRKRYPSDDQTPAVAGRVDRQQYEDLVAIAQRAGVPLAHVIRAIIIDFLQRYHQGTAKIGRVDVNHGNHGEIQGGVRHLVTRVVNDMP